MRSIRNLSAHLLAAIIALSWLGLDADAQSIAIKTTTPTASAPVATAPTTSVVAGTRKHVHKERSLAVDVIDYDKEFVGAYAGGSAYALGERDSLEYPGGEDVTNERAYASEQVSGSADVFGIHADLFSISGYASTYSWDDGTARAPVSYARVITSIRGETVFSDKQTNFVSWNDHDKLTLFQAEKWIMVGFVPVRVSVSTGAELGGEMIAGAYPKAGKDDVANITSMFSAGGFGSAGVYVDSGVFVAGIEGTMVLFDTALTCEWSARPALLDLDLRQQVQALSISVRIVLYVRRVSGTWYKPWTYHIELDEVDHKTLFTFDCDATSKSLIDETY